MKPLLIVLLSALSLVAQQGPPPLVSPEVGADRTITFRVKAPNAQKVLLQLEGAKPQPMTKDDAGIWSATTPPLEPQIYGYGYNIDGVAFVDPAGGPIKTNALSIQSMVLVPGATPMPWERTDVAHGVVHHFFFESKIVGDKRDCYVYTPPNYNPKKAYPLMVLMHGFSDYADGWTTVGKANLILDAGIAKGDIKPMIVLMPLGYGAPEILRRGTGPRDPSIGDRNIQKFGESLLQEAIPLVEKNFKLAKGPQNRAIIGLSMGGGESLVVGLNHLDQFSWVGAMSAGVPSDPDKSLPNLTEKDNAKLKLLWIACGKDDFLYKNNLKFNEWLTQKQIHYTWVESAGGHVWMNWRDYLTLFAKELRW